MNPATAATTAVTAAAGARRPKGAFVLAGLDARRQPLPARKDVRHQLAHRFHADGGRRQARAQLLDGAQDPIKLRWLPRRSRRCPIDVFEHQREPRADASRANPD